MEKPVTARSKDFLLDTIEIAQLAAREYLAPVRAVRRWTRTVARLPNYLESQERTGNDIRRICDGIRFDIDKLRSEIAAVRETCCALKDVITQPTEPQEKSEPAAPMIDKSLEAQIAAIRDELLAFTRTISEVDKKPKPAVPVAKSVTPEYIICLEDGKKFKSLKRHLRTHYDLSPEEYRQKWGLPKDYPMVAPHHAPARPHAAKKVRG